MDESGTLSPQGELGAFLRAHRERLRPDASRLPNGSTRRRTPGLRREEVAQLAGVSAIWYMRIEQGRATAVSSDTLARLAGALRLGHAERAHLFHLAGRLDPVVASSSQEEALPKRLVELIEAFRGPAYVLDGFWNVRAANAGSARLFGSWIEAADANLLRYVFVHPSAQDLIVSWEERARRILAEFRADIGRRLQDQRLAALVESLRNDSPQFRQWWEERQVRGREGGQRHFNHPSDGLVRFEQLTLIPADDRDYKVVMLLQSAAGAELFSPAIRWHGCS